MSSVQPDVQKDDASEPDTAPVSPATLERMHLVKIHAGKDGLGKTRVNYTKEGVSQSAQTEQDGKSDDDIPEKLKEFLDLVKILKKNFVLLDKSAVTPGASGTYLEDVDFKYVEEVLGRGNMNGDIMVAIDSVTETKHAVKKIMVISFREEEIRVWYRLKDSDSFPKLYCLRKEKQGVFIHMEPIEGITLQEVIDEHMMNLRKTDPDLVRPFSLWVFHDLLSVVKEIHDKNWAHCDLQGGNVMLTKESMSVKVLDFGSAKQLRGNFASPLVGPDGFDHNALKFDILNVVRLACGVYVGNMFNDHCHLEESIKNGTLGQELMGLEDNEKEEMMQLITMAYRVIQDSRMKGYGNPTPVMNHLEDVMYKEKRNHDEVLMKVAAILFPDFRKGDREVQSQEDEGADAASDGQEDSGDAAAASLTGDLLKSLKLRF